MDIVVREPETEPELEQYYDLRWRVLSEPWAQARESGRDEHEREAVHLTAWMDDRLVGVGRLHFNSPDQGQIRYISVEPACAGQGIGGRILRALKQRAAEKNTRCIVLNGRESALGFYRKNGYRPMDRSGRLFNSIEHWWMEKDL